MNRVIMELISLSENFTQSREKIISKSEIKIRVICSPNALETVNPNSRNSPREPEKKVEITIVSQYEYTSHIDEILRIIEAIKNLSEINHADSEEEVTGKVSEAIGQLNLSIFNYTLKVRS